MTDRELLELAAKAAGATWIDDSWPQDLPGLMLDFGNGTTQWNPLDDDGDALRLAIVCRLTVCTDDDATVSASEQWRGDSPASVFITQSVCECDDKHAATRRAIVRAAAEIGRKMP
jgi:hypothetical protein